MTRVVTLPNVDAPEPAVSNHELRRFLAGELTPERRADIERDALLQPALHERLAKLAAEQRAEDAAFALEVPLPRFLRDHEARAQRATAKSGGLFARLASIRFTFGAGALAAAACAVFLLVQPVDGGDGDAAIDGAGGVRWKGDARVGFLVRESDGARFGTDGEQLGAGDQIQFAVKDDAAHGAMVLVGVDGRGVVTVYAAEHVDGERAKGVPGEQVKPRILGESVVLDDATGAERFFVVYGDPPLEALRRTVEDAARTVPTSALAHTERLPLPREYTQSSVHIVKVPSG
jgi:hypothetical protein